MISLDKLRDKEGIIKSIKTDPLLKRRLRELGLIEGTRISFSGISPFGDPIQYNIRGYIISIRKEHAKKIIIEEEE
jgi:ferrous iron transport protein A